MPGRKGCRAAILNALQNLVLENVFDYKQHTYCPCPQVENHFLSAACYNAAETHSSRFQAMKVGEADSPTFRRKPDHKRQEMIWNALEGALGKQSVRMVGMLLAYSPEEWNPELSLESTKRARNKGDASVYRDCA